MHGVGARARLLTGGRALTTGDYAHGTYFEPTVLDRVTSTMRIGREEVFGPVVSLLEFETFNEAIEIANSIDDGFSVSPPLAVWKSGRQTVIRHPPELLKPA